MAEGTLIDVRRRLVQAQRLLDGQSPALNPLFARALYSMLLAFAKYVELDEDEIGRLIEIAMAADTIDQGAVDVLVALGNGERPIV